jgi:hypothetical protein
MYPAALLSRLQRGKREGGLYIFSLRPVVIRVAFKAARLSVIWSRGMARFAGGNSGNQHIGRLCAR